MFSQAFELFFIENDNSDFLFFKKDYYKYCYLTIKDLITKLPYLALVDEFQETVYKNQFNMHEIHKCWISLANKYRLNISNQGRKNLDNGGYFYRINHIF